VATKKMSSTTVYSAGAVIISGEKRHQKVAVIHRPHRNDWSFPKGKIDFPETNAAAAFREVLEETGLEIVLQQPLPEHNYIFDDLPKTVYYWRARLVGESEFIPNEEADELLWLSPKDAIKILTYEEDKQLVNQAIEASDTVPFVLMRHAQAEKRSDWSERYKGDSPSDNFRPLNQTGVAQSILISDTLRAFGIKKLISSDSTRCISTITPYAASIEAPVEAHQTLSELGWSTNNLPALTLAFNNATLAESLVICAHRPTLPHLANELTHALQTGPIDGALQPGAFLVIHREKNNLENVVAIERIEIEEDF
jgi:8-oxo-dGTP diphosphatase